MKKALKYLLGTVIIGGGLTMVNSFFFSSNIFPNIPNSTISTVYAQDAKADAKQGDQDQKKGTEEQEGFVKFMEQILKVVYIILWPLLFIAGKTLDNSLVYGEIFHLDSALWKFWNLMKNFSNYVLGFMFLISILMYFFHYNSEKFKPKKILPKLVIGAIGIQASWFLVGALLDLSTIATYSIGAMPLTVMKGTELGKRPIIASHMTMSLDSVKNIMSGGQDLQGYMSVGDVNLIWCNTKKEGNKTTLQKIDDDYIKKFVDPTKININKDFCIIQGSYNVVPVGGELNKDSFKAGEEFLRSKSSGEGVITLGNMIEKTTGMTGPLMTLYTTITNTAGYVMEASNKSITSLIMLGLMKVIVGIALMIPLLTLAVVLIIRVVVMWLVIGFSPFLVLSQVFEFKFGDLEKKGSLKSILGLIFMPVTAVFAISLSLLFLVLVNESLTQLTNSSASDADNTQKTKILGVEKCKNDKPNCIKFSQLGNEMSIGSPTKNVGISDIMNIFSWLVINFFSIALMWAVVFAAMKTSDVTNSVVGGIQHFAEGIAKATPIVPLAGGLSYSGMKSGASQIAQIPNTLQQKELTDKINPHIQHLQEMISPSQSTKQLETSYTNLNNKRGPIATTDGDAIRNNFMGTPSNMTAFGVNGAKDVLKKITGTDNVDEAMKSKDFLELMSQGNADLFNFAENQYSKVAGVPGTKDKEHAHKVIFEGLNKNNKGAVISDTSTRKLVRVKDQIYTLDTTNEKIEKATKLSDNLKEYNSSKKLDSSDLVKLVGLMNDLGEIKGKDIGILISGINIGKIEVRENNNDVNYKIEWNDTNKVFESTKIP